MEQDEDNVFSTIQTNRPMITFENNKSIEENNKRKSIKLIENEKEEESEDDDILDEEKELLNNYLKYQNIVVEKKEEEDKENFKQKFEQFLNDTLIKSIIHYISAILSLVAFIIYLVSTYYPLSDFEWATTVDYFFSAFFNIEYLMNLYLSQHRISFIFNLDNICDLLIFLIPYFASIKNRIVQKLIECSKGLLVFKTTKAFIQNFRMSENDLARLLIGIILNFANLIIFITIVYRAVEIDTINFYIMDPNYKNKKLKYQSQFHDFLYFVITTTATIGYGDIFPLTELGRVIIVILISIMIILVPQKVSDLMSILGNSSVYSRDIYKANIEVPHLVICGHVTVDSLKNFCNELFHVDHGQGDKNVVILDPAKPSQDMLRILHTGKYELNLKYLQGNPINGKDLQRTDIQNAKVCVIMTDKFSDEPHSADHRNILISLAIKKYFLQNKMYDSILFIQLIKPENKIHYQNGLQSLSINGKIGNDQVIIVEEIKMNLLSKSCLIPGIIPMITNLVTSSGSCDETEFTWLNEYLDGTGNEIYRAELNEQFKNHTFCQISKKIYEEYDAIAFALEIDINGKTMISLNPGEFFIEKSREEREDVKFYIYVICSDKEIADQIEEANQLNDNEESELSDKENEKNENNDSGQHKIMQTKFHDYMKMYLSDIQELDENDFLNEPCEEEDDYYIIKNFVNNNVDVKKDSIRNSDIYKNHIVVCGTHPSLYYYILPLRARYLGKENLKYLVLLTNDMPKDLWDSISRFENIILINGSPLNIEDLLRANIEYADKAVVLGNNNNNNKNVIYNNQMIDCETVFIYKAIKKCNPNIQIMTELVYDSNIEFLLPDEELEKFDNGIVSYESTSVFSSGEVYISSIIDTLTCQAYYNKHIVTIIHQLLTGGKNSSNHTLSYICENIGLKSSNLWHMTIPTKFINKTFLELYIEFCDKNIIPLGLYRLPGARDNNHPYIYTKPVPDTRLTHRDKIFVLAINPVKTYKFDRDEIDDIEIDNNSSINNNLTDKFEAKDKDLDYHDSIVEDGFGQNKFTPLKYVEDMLTEMEKNVSDLRQLLNTTKKNIHESISNGIKQEITSILH